MEYIELMEKLLDNGENSEYEFKKAENFSDYDSTQDVLVHNNGQIFVTIKNYTEGVGNPSLSEDETTSAE